MNIVYCLSLCLSVRFFSNGCLWNGLMQGNETWQDGRPWVGSRSPPLWWTLAQGLIPQGQKVKNFWWHTSRRSCARSGWNFSRWHRGSCCRSPPRLVNFGPGVNPSRPKSEKSIMHSTVVSQLRQTGRTATKHVTNCPRLAWWRRSACGDIRQSG